MMKPMDVQMPEVILPLDFESTEEAWEVLRRIGSELKWVKVGLQMYLQWGPAFVHALSDAGYRIFLDLKLFDIPNTVAGAVRSLGELPVDLTTLHASGGEAMMKAAVEARDTYAPHIRLLGVTVLTSMGETAMNAVGVPGQVEDQVWQLAMLARANGVDGVVCSPHELGMLRSGISEPWLYVTPGVRPAGSSADDQTRILTPGQAVRAGASFLVIGRPITAADEPVKAFEAIRREMVEALDC